MAKRVSRTKPMKAWLLKWEWSAPHAAVEDAIAAILPSRWSRERVSEALWLIYHLRDSNVAELSVLARNPKNSPYPVHWEGDMAWIGGHPALIASKVEKLVVETHAETSVETMSYTMPPLYRLDVETMHSETVRGPLPVTVSRSRTGPLSNRRVLRESSDPQNA